MGVYEITVGRIFQGGVGMERWEYEALQDALTKKSENNPYGRTGNFKREDGYKEGILAAKSILHSFYERQSRDKEVS